ncbi:MAG: tetratricopeptide repeat protein [Ornithinimicrobium sp.]
MDASTARASLALGAVLLAGTTIVAAQAGTAPPEFAAESTTSGTEQAQADPLLATIADLQADLEESPDDGLAWAELGAAYVEQARVSADPSYYPKAEGALETSLEVQPEGNDEALTAQGALANARHDFADAADYAEQAQQVNVANSTSWGVRADALIQLGDYDGATDAVQQMLDLRPGLASYSRASYDLELNGEPQRAREAMELALEGAYSPADVAFCRYYLGQLSFNSGDLEGAQKQFERGLAAVLDDPTLLAGQARVYAALGDEEQARAVYDRVVAARPLPDYLVEYGFYLQSLGDTDAADEQFDTFEAVQQIFESNGVQDDLTSAYVAADRGQAELALRHAEAEWDARQNIDSADAMAWALHGVGREDEALEFADKANRLDGDNAMFLYHRGMIQQALGDDDQAIADLEAALDTNPHFSPVHATRAEQALTELGETS